jgi:DNA-binding response OmpR family regulator
VAYDGREALKLAQNKQPDLIVLDLMLPGIDGLEVCRILRQESQVPIIMLTAKTTEQDKITGLDIGADDYLTKPFSPGELLARIRAVLRRVKVEGEAPEKIAFGKLKIDFSRHEVLVGGRAVNLTPTEFRLLEVMVRDPGRVFTRLQLIHAALGYDFEGFERTIDVHIKNLRKKMEPDPRNPRYIKTIFGVGYKFDPEG